MTLTAAALNTLVNAPFTMPDGTTRRALWERVRETRPRFLRDFRDDAVFDRTLAWADDGEVAGAFCAAFVVDDEVRYDPEPVFVGEAATLIRVAIEDWITSPPHNCDIHAGQYLVCPESQRWRVGLHHGNGVDELMLWTGPTRLHATITAAHGLADALGTPP